MLVLNQNTKRESGRKVQLGNIKAAKTISDIVSLINYLNHRYFILKSYICEYTLKITINLESLSTDQDLSWTQGYVENAHGPHGRNCHDKRR